MPEWSADRRSSDNKNCNFGKSNEPLDCFRLFKCLLVRSLYNPYGRDLVCRGIDCVGRWMHFLAHCSCLLRSDAVMSCGRWRRCDVTWRKGTLYEESNSYFPLFSYACTYMHFKRTAMGCNAFTLPTTVTTFIYGLILEVMQYDADKRTRLSKPTASVPVGTHKILISVLEYWLLFMYGDLFSSQILSLLTLDIFFVIVITCFDLRCIFLLRLAFECISCW